jgi:hypothetical protein
MRTGGGNNPFHLGPEKRRRRHQEHVIGTVRQPGICLLACTCLTGTE